MPTAGIHNLLPFSTEFGDGKNNLPTLFIPIRYHQDGINPVGWVRRFFAVTNQYSVRYASLTHPTCYMLLPFSTVVDGKDNIPALFIISQAGGMESRPYPWTILAGKLLYGDRSK